MIARSSVLLLLAAGFCWGRPETVVTARLKVEFKAAHTYAPPATIREDLDLSGEPALVLEPMVITSSHSFAVDILAEARRAAAARAAMKFSPLQGGLIHSYGRGDLGFWPRIMPMDETPVKKGTVGISVDLFRIKW